eukprot:2273788-Pleurochrysis_carterae.AAC.2
MHASDKEDQTCMLRTGGRAYCAGHACLMWAASATADQRIPGRISCTGMQVSASEEGKRAWRPERLGGILETLHA